METIEERANQYMIEERSSIIKSGYDISFYDIERAYKTGATEQQKIDLEEFEKNRISACESMTETEYYRESSYIIEFIKKNHRLPTISDAIEDTRKLMIEKALEVYSDLLSAQGYCLGTINGEMARMKKALED